MTTKIADLIREIKKPGKIYMPVLIANDVVHIAIEKSNLIDVLLSNYSMTSKAPWKPYGFFNGGLLLDINNE